MALELFKFHKGYNIQDAVHGIYGSADPSAGGGVAAPISSIYHRTSDGTTWHKVGSGDTQWNQLLDSAGASTEDGYQNSFMGKTGVGNELPTYSSNNVVADNDSLETAIGKLDTEIGAAITGAEVRTFGPISDQAINLNILALDNAIGSDAEHASTYYTTVNSSINTKVSALDAAIYNKSPRQVSAANQDASLGMTVDSVAVASYGTCEWLLSINSYGTPANVVACKVVARNDGSTSVDHTIYGYVELGSAIAGLAIDVDIDTGSMRLRVTASENIDYEVSRIYQ